MTCTCIDVSGLFTEPTFVRLVNISLLFLLFLFIGLLLGLVIEWALDSYVIRQTAAFLRGEKPKGKPKRGDDDEDC